MRPRPQGSGPDPEPLELSRVRGRSAIFGPAHPREERAGGWIACAPGGGDAAAGGAPGRLRRAGSRGLSAWAEAEAAAESAALPAGEPERWVRMDSGRTRGGRAGRCLAAGAALEGRWVGASKPTACPCRLASSFRSIAAGSAALARVGASLCYCPACAALWAKHVDLHGE